LHDEVGATLSSISIFSQAAIQKNESGNMADSKNILERIGETSRDVMGELNDAVWLINPLNDNLQKIIQRISNYALPLCRTNNIHFEINAAASVENLDLSVDKRKAIYLIIKEAVNNSLKYAAAKNLIIQFEKNHKALRISVKDDGNGFASNNAFSGNGLNNMKQRAKDVNGKIDFDSVQQKGTEIILQVPLTNIGD
jgi:signal transduction histidine kinase